MLMQWFVDCYACTVVSVAYVYADGVWGCEGERNTGVGAWMRCGCGECWTCGCYTRFRNCV